MACGSLIALTSLAALVLATGVVDAAAQGHHGHHDAAKAPVAASVPPPGAPAPDAVKACLAKGPDGAKCLDALFREFLKTRSTEDALAVVRGYEATDPELHMACHPIVHAVGRETFRIKGAIHDSFAACDQTCHSGCYHGAVERFLLGDGVAAGGHVSVADLKAKTSTACDPGTPYRLRFQCLHGLGHALMFFSGYQLTNALEICDTLPDQWSQTSCHGGVFMENVFSATPEKRDVSPTDFHYPCNRIAEKYRAECYIIQTWRMSEMGLSTERLFDECTRAGAFQSRCMQSIGRDLSNDVRVKDPRQGSAQCELVDGEDRRACIRGVVYALIDNTWDGSYAFPFCATFLTVGDTRYCFKTSTEYLKTTFEKSAQEIRGQCSRYVPGRPQPCLQAAVP